MTTWPDAIVIATLLVCTLIGWIAWLRWGQR